MTSSYCLSLDLILPSYLSLASLSDSTCSLRILTSLRCISCMYFFWFLTSSSVLMRSFSNSFLRSSSTFLFFDASDKVLSSCFNFFLAFFRSVILSSLAIISSLTVLISLISPLFLSVRNCLSFLSTSISVFRLLNLWSMLLVSVDRRLITLSFSSMVARRSALLRSSWSNLRI